MTIELQLGGRGMLAAAHGESHGSRKLHAEQIVELAVCDVAILLEVRRQDDLAGWRSPQRTHGCIHVWDP